VADSPPIERYLVRLRLTAPVRFHFLHGAVLRGLLSGALGEHELPEGVVPAAAESGQARFEAGEAYHLGLTFVGDHRAAAAPLLAGLQRLGRAEPGRDAPPTLGGNFLVEAAEPLPPSTSACTRLSTTCWSAPRPPARTASSRTSRPAAPSGGWASWRASSPNGAAGARCGATSRGRKRPAEAAGSLSTVVRDRIEVRPVGR
jgi:hypothetical protein